jgi:Calcineurin-like phosphoesterase
VRALVISDTHFGAWTGEDILREPETLALLEPHLDVDEVILLGDMFDFLFSSMQDAFKAAGPLLDLLRDKLQGKRFVFLAGNHDHFDYESTITMLTGLLFMIAQLPNGTQAQQRAFAAFQAVSRAIRVGAAPVRTVEHASDVVASLVGAQTRAARRMRRITSAADIADYHGAMLQEAERRQQTGPWPGTAVLIDSDEPDPRLLKIRDHLNPLYRDSTNNNREGTKDGI